MDRSKTAATSEGHSDLELLSGFVCQPDKLGLADARHLLRCLRIRSVAAASGEPGSLKQIAREMRISVRTISNYFPRWEAIYAFPPPEMAAAIVESSRRVEHLGEVPGALRPLLDALDTNLFGRALLTNLVRIREGYPELRAADNYFNVELVKLLTDRDGPLEARQVILSSHFTEVLRVALQGYATDPSSTAAVTEKTLRWYLTRFVVAPDPASVQLTLFRF